MSFEVCGFNGDDAVRSADNPVLWEHTLVAAAIPPVDEVRMRHPFWEWHACMGGVEACMLIDFSHHVHGIERGENCNGLMIEDASPLVLPRFNDNRRGELHARSLKY